MTYMLCAGEASGDLHASELIKALRVQDPEARFVFLGGDLMAQAAGVKPAIHYRDMAYMGFVDVVKHLDSVAHNLKVAGALLERIHPDALILIDYPSFNLRLAAEAKRLDIPTYYYISPKVWAWKEWRTEKIKELCRLVFGIFPFEPEFYRRHGYERCIYVGNPSVEEIDRRLASAPTAEEFKRQHGLSEKPIIAIVPGSRVGEIQRNLPIMLEAARVLQSKYQAVIAGAPGVDSGRYNTQVPVVFNATTELMHAASTAIVTSGTASLEAALAGVPQVVCYRHTGSRVLYAAMSRVLKIPYVSLPNLVAGEQVVPELLLHKCTPIEVLRYLVNVLPGHKGHDAQIRGYQLIREKLGTTHAAATAARLLLADLR
ncbi:MAG: lipid-A-disaccharide synthase [Bacteroides sp.]|nr:lipid-A-disaccharide synthase [Bacteroides sp.]MCM1379148.1 lipid-A-disaccharide synthase [Bacteroides sp.]MCM1445342.1 lipid-A-disaccharide synthase [Prevotella sp.]